MIFDSMAHADEQSRDPFRQLDEILPTPNHYRTASGAPGHRYWQQQVDYRISVELDEDDRRLTGTETITYYNRSPDGLAYLWLQLEQNRFRKDSDDLRTNTVDSVESMSFEDYRATLLRREFDGGYRIESVTDAHGEPLPHTIVGTMMRVDLEELLPSNTSTQLTIDWSYRIPDARTLDLRGGYESFDDGNQIYGLAQWFPRLAVYSDYRGWQLKQFLGAGEFSLEFGDYVVDITVPADHIVAATGELQNADEVLTQVQRERLAEATRSDRPVFVTTPEEAARNQQTRTRGTKTWRFEARNVRDFAWASSRKFIWDAQGYDQQMEGRADGRAVLAMSFYPGEAEPLWSKYSTKAIVHTLEVYSQFTFPYPYPVAQSITGPVADAMEYPMIVFNTPRPEQKGKAVGTYTRESKRVLISDTIHEIGHMYFPMIVNSDERQWTWMDEGLNSFVQYIAEQAWDHDYPSRRGEPQEIVDYMVSERQSPIMTSSDSVLQFSDNAYGKAAVALNILRETILGRERFDHAFREYARRWKFKRAEPADFFRTMEDASGTDLDWFWRGWFYTTDYVDLAIDGVVHARMDTMNPDVEAPLRREEQENEEPHISVTRNRDLSQRVDEDPELLDFYDQHDEYTVTEKQREEYREFLFSLEEWQREILSESENIYFVCLSNKGGLVMPVILQIEYERGDPELLRIPAEIWRYDAKRVTKMLIRDREIKAVRLDPYYETADADTANNYWPRMISPGLLKLYGEDSDRNLMQEVRDE